MGRESTDLPMTTDEVSLDLPSQAHVMGDAPAVIMGRGQRMSYRELDEGSNRVAQLLHSEGLRPGDHIAILMENNLHYLEIAWGAQRSGLYYTAINSHLRQNEVQYILDDCGASAIVATPTVASAVEPLDLSRVKVRLSVGGELAGFDSYETSIATQPATPIDGECEGREMLYSSGTTGRPKGVQKQLPLTALGDLSAAPVLIASRLSVSGAGPGAVYLSPAPLYHSAPLVYSMSMHRLGAVVVVMEHFDPRDCLELIQKHGVTHAQFVPTMFTRLLGVPPEERAKYDISSLRFVVHAAAPCPVETKRRMLEWWGPIIHEYYGGTEDMGSTWIRPEEWLGHPGSVGRSDGAGAHRRADGDGGADRRGRDRVLRRRTTLRVPQQSRQALDSMTNERGGERWAISGFSMPRVFVPHRPSCAHDHRGGVNIYPQEAENVLSGHPSGLPTSRSSGFPTRHGRVRQGRRGAGDDVSASPELEAS